MTITTTIQDLPEVPNTNDPDFETKAPTLLNAIRSNFVPETNKVSDEMNALSAEVNQMKDDTEDFKDLTQTASEIAMQASNFQGIWSGSTTYAKNESVIKNGVKYFSKTDSNLNHDPLTDSTNWGILNQTLFQSEIERNTRNLDNKNARGGSGFDTYGTVSGENINTGMKADGQTLIIAEHIECVNGILKTIAEHTYTIPEAQTDELARQDLLGAEYFTIDSSTIDFLYAGNGDIRSQASTMNTVSTVTASFSGVNEFSKLGNWEATATIGKGVVLSTLTTENLQKIVSENSSIFIGEDGKVYQDLRRTRVIKGKTVNGAEWVNNGLLMKKSLRYNSSNYLTPKGIKISISSDLLTWTPYLYTGAKNTQLGYYAPENLDTLLGYKGQCYFLPIAMIPRNINQGGYHPTHNKNGSKKFSDGNDWNDTSVSITSTADCFISGNLLSASGYIASASSGNPFGLYYDEIYSSSVRDLRIKTTKRNEITKAFNDVHLAKLTSNEVRGYESEFKITSYFLSSSDVSSNSFIDRGVGYITSVVFDIPILPNFGSVDLLSEDYACFVVGNDGLYYELIKSLDNYTYFHPKHGDIRSKFTPLGSADYKAILCKKTDNFSNDTISRCEIIGDPTSANYIARIQEGHVGVPNVNDVNDLSSNLPDGSKTDFLLSRIYSSLSKVYKNGVLLTYTTDYTYSTTTRKISFVVAPVSTDVILIFGEGYASEFESVENSVVEGKAVSSTFESSYNDVEFGASQLNHIIGKIAVSSSGVVVDSKEFTRALINSDDGKLSTNTTTQPETIADVLLTGTIGHPTMKSFMVTVNIDGLLYNILIFKEMIYDTAWRDNAKFDIVNNIVTTTDTVGNVIIIGQVKSIHPVGFANEDN